MSSKLFKLAALALSVLPGTILGQSDAAGPWRFVPPNAKAVVSIDWAHIRKSHVAAMAREKWVNGATVPGSEFLDDADRFIVTSVGRTADDPNAEAPLLIVVSGHFDLVRVRAVLTEHKAKPQKYNAYQVYRPQGKDAKDLAFTLVDAQTILIGDSRSMFACLDRTSFPQGEPAAGSLASRAADKDSSYDVWAIVNTPGALGGDRLTALLSGSDGDVAIQGLEFGLALRNGLAAETTLTFNSDSVAKRMSSELSRMFKMAVKDKIGEPALVDLEKKMKFTTEGSAVKISVRLTAQELEKNSQIFAASHKAPAPGIAQVRPVVKPEPPPPAKPEKKVIRIEGLDDGPREIPYQDRQ
ncbi:MAG TPA: hypothetical protein VKX49_10945 [Bryobacteraceae bacterium]|nr:hypothetical protein [Bryobacteraceae bacterium]